MDVQAILSKCDHTLLRPDASAGEIRDLCDEAIAYGCASVCIPPAHVSGAKKYVADRIPICTVVGFPNGYTTGAAKKFETHDMVLHGADEIDMMINLGMVKDSCWGNVLDEIRTVRYACQDQALKVIIETALLTMEEKIQLCAIVSASGADYIKTSTGFGPAGATFEDVQTLRRYCDPRVKIKAAGGIRTLEDAERFLALGADRLGSSVLVRLAAERERQEREQRELEQQQVMGLINPELPKLDSLPDEMPWDEIDP